MAAAGTGAVSCVELANVVGRALPFQATAAPGSKPMPSTVSVKAGPPATTEAGEIEPIAAPGAIVKAAGGEIVPPTATVTCAVPGAARKLAGLAARRPAAPLNPLRSRTPVPFTT